MPRRRLRVKMAAPAIKVRTSNGVAYSTARGGPALGFAPAGPAPSGLLASDAATLPLVAGVAPGLAAGAGGAKSARARGPGPFAPPANHTRPSLGKGIRIPLPGSE